MDEKRKLKKLVLKKEEIVNLNDYQMGQAVGGSTWSCVKSVIEISVSVYSVVESIYGNGKDNSWWNCEYSKQANCMTDISNKLVNLPDGSRACELPDVNIYGYRP